MSLVFALDIRQARQGSAHGHSMQFDAPPCCNAPWRVGCDFRISPVLQKPLPDGFSPAPSGHTSTRPRAGSG